MSNCHVTGIEIDLREAYVLHVSVALKNLRKRKRQVLLLEKLLQDFGKREIVQVATAEGKTVSKKRNRLLCHMVVQAYIQDLECSEDLFILFTDLCELGKRLKKKTKMEQGKPEASDESPG